MKQINVRLGTTDYAALARRAETSGRAVSGEAAELLRAALSEGARDDRLAALEKQVAGMRGDLARVAEWVSALLKKFVGGGS